MIITVCIYLVSWITTVTGLEPNVRVCYNDRYVQKLHVKENTHAVTMGESTLLWKQRRAYTTLLCENLRYYETTRCYGNRLVATGVTVTTAISALLRYDERFS